MTIGASLALVAAAAILRWAVMAHVTWIDLQTAGTVLFVVGLVGLPLALLYTFWWTGGRGVRAPAPPLERP